MMKLAIDDQHARIFIGMDSASHVLPVGSTVTQATLVTPDFGSRDLPSGPMPAMSSWIFHELSFDPTARLRRGNLYQPEGKPWPADQVLDHPPKELQLGAQRISEFKFSRRAYLYEPCRLVFQKLKERNGATLAIGTAELWSLWRIVQAEISVGGAVLVTLKSRGFLGSLQNIDLKEVDADFRGDIESALDRASDAAHRESPVSVVDQCRNALTVCLSRWLIQEYGAQRSALTDDLSVLAKKLPQERQCVSAMATLIARLHSRGKDNERDRHQTRTPNEYDADLAVQALGFALREFGWATDDTA